MLEFRKFTVEDALELSQNAIDDTLQDADIDLIKQTSEFYINSGPSGTGFYNGKPICSCGINLRRGHSGRIWLLIGDTKHKFMTLRSLKTLLSIYIKEYGFKKLIAESRIGFPQSQRVLEFFGFEKQRHNLNNEYYFYRKAI